MCRRIDMERERERADETISSLLQPIYIQYMIVMMTAVDYSVCTIDYPLVLIIVWNLTRRACNDHQILQQVTIGSSILNSTIV